MNDTGGPLMGMTSAVSIFHASQRYFNFQLQHTTDITEQIYTFVGAILLFVVILSLVFPFWMMQR